MGIYKRLSEKSGFCPVVVTESFKCAYITHSPDYAFGEVRLMKRHNLTDEVFVLLAGKAVMLTFEDENFTETPLLPYTAYTVEKGTYHYLAVSEGASVFVCERSDTGAGNTDTIFFDNPYFMEDKNV